MENISELKNELWWREGFLTCALIALRTYKLTNDKQFYEKFKIFGEWIKQCDERIKRIHETPNKRSGDEKGCISQSITKNEIDLPW